MKKIFALLSTVAALTLATSATTAIAKEKQVTVKGDAKCAMCQLKEGSACQTVIQTEKKGKTETYYVVNNDVSKGFHADVCHSTQKVVAKGTVAEVDGKKQITLKKIDVASK